MAKADKDALKKNQFWIILGAFFVLWFVAVIIVKVSASDAAKKKWEEAQKKVAGAKSGGIKTEAYMTPWDNHAKKFRDHKDVIWKQAWDQQKYIYTWPESMPRSAQPLYFDDPFGRDAAGNKDPRLDLNIRSKFKTDWYKEQFVGLKTLVYPAEFNGPFESIFPQQFWDASQTPTAEEIWLAQEDFWIRREMLYIIRDALNSVALMKEVPVKNPELLTDKKTKKTRIFRNANWELTLMLEEIPGSRTLQISDTSTIKNVNSLGKTQFLAHPKSNQGLAFVLRQGNVNDEILIAGEPVPAGGQTPLKKKYKLPRLDLRSDFSVEQVLDWEISPIRRVDSLLLAHHSHRTASLTLKINEELKKLEPVVEEEAPPTGGGGGGMGSGMGMSSGMMGGGPGMPSPGGEGGGRGGAAAVDSTRVNKIPRPRYIQVTPQARHLPIALRLVVDQGHIQDVLTAVSNSLLRIQITQVSIHHLRNVTRGTTSAPGSGGPPMGMGGTGGGTLGSDSGMGMSPGMGMMMGRGGRPMGGGEEGQPYNPYIPGSGSPSGPGGFSGTAPAETTSKFIDNAKLVELSVYGIAALYERFPPKKKDPAATESTPK